MVLLTDGRLVFCLVGLVISGFTLSGSHRSVGYKESSPLKKRYAFVCLCPDVLRARARARVCPVKLKLAWLLQIVDMCLLTTFKFSARLLSAEDHVTNSVRRPPSSH